MIVSSLFFAIYRIFTLFALATFLCLPIKSQVIGMEYVIVNVGSGLALDVPSNVATNGTPIQQWTSNGNPQQKWIITVCDAAPGNYCPNQTYNIKNTGNNNATELGFAPNSGAGAHAQIQTPGTDPSQRWTFLPIPGTRYFNIVNVASGLYLEVPGDSQSNGSPIQQWSGNGYIQQQWMLVPTAKSYYIWNGSGYGYLEVPNASTSNGTTVDLYNGNADPTNSSIQWFFIPVPGTNLFNIVNQKSGLGLDVPGGSRTAGQTIQQWQLNGNAQQKWILGSSSGGFFTIVNQDTSLGLEQIRLSQGVDQAQPAGTSNQSWTIYVANTNPATGVTSPVGNCSKSACLNACNTSNKACTTNETSPPNNGSCSSVADHDLAVCIQNCPYPGSPSAAYCADACLFSEIGDQEMCQSVQNYGNSCNYQLQGCQSECSQCTQN